MQVPMQLEQPRLASFACHPPSKCSRLHQIKEDEGRSPFQRDCDRIVHAKAFRRLMHKTQVFVAPDGDHFRTRLTHTIEVSRVAKSLATTLCLNADLADAVALAHDLGHPPFGHAGEEALSEVMRDYGGFEHNAQAIRIVTELERQYIGHDGLNLTRETLEGIAKHNGPVSGEVPFALAEYNRKQDLALDLRAGAEAQVAALADDVAYVCHDLQDGLAAGMLTLAEIGELPIAGPILHKLNSKHFGAEQDRIAQSMLRALFKSLTLDIIRTSRSNFEGLKPQTVDDIRTCGRNVVGFSDETIASLSKVRQFLREKMYRTGSIEVQRQKGKKIVQTLFSEFMNDIGLLPPAWQRWMSDAGTDAEKARVLADFIAGMTDNYAIGVYSDIGPVA